MKARDYKNLSEEELKENIKVLKFDMMRTKGLVEETGLKPEHRRKFKREIAKIKTILRERELKKGEKGDDTDNNNTG